jgi:hypothetical protein
MKKLLALSLVTLFLVFSSPALAGWNGEVWLGTISGGKWPANPSFTSAAKYTAGMEIGYGFNIGPITFNPYSKINVYADERLENKYTFHPAGAQFYSGIEISYKDIFVGAEHMCFHPIDISGKVYQYDMIKFGFRFGKR